MDKRKHADHYHVNVGMPGYLPDNGYAVETLAEAGDLAYYEAENFRDAGYHSDCDDHIGHVTGTKRRGYGYEVNRHQYLHDDGLTFVYMTISISGCDETECRCPHCHTLYDFGGYGVCPNECEVCDTQRRLHVTR
jgi:hypothetical protein